MAATITTRDEWKASRAISNALATKLRAGTASPQDEAEYHERDEAEHAWKRRNVPAPRWGSSSATAPAQRLA